MKWIVGQVSLSGEQRKRRRRSTRLVERTEGSTGRHYRQDKSGEMENEDDLVDMLLGVSIYGFIIVVAHIWSCYCEQL
jgi:hypothetical protein